MIAKHLVLISLITVLTVQMFPFEWVGILIDTKTGAKNISKLISLSATDEEDSSENNTMNEPIKFLKEEDHSFVIVTTIELNKHFPIYLDRFLAHFYSEIIIPPPNSLA